jgi:hypothetical protein
MGQKKMLYHLAIRIGILMLLLIGLSDSIDQVAFFLSQTYCLFLLLEMIYFFVKKNKKFGLINLAIIIIIEIIPVLLFIKLMV